MHQAFGPAGLLRFEAVHVHGKFRSTLNFREVQELPALELRAVGEIGVFGEGVVLPAAGGVDGRAAPDARGAIEIEE